MPSLRRHSIWCGLVLAFFVCVMASGCGSKTASVSGTVKYNGQPLPSGTITFLCQSGEKQVRGSDIKDGAYSVQALNPGPVQVTVVTIAPAKAGAAPSGSPTEASKATPAGKYVPIPPRYANPDKSGLNFELKGGSQTKDFDLTP